MSPTGVLVLLVVAAAQGLQQPRLVYPRLLEERSSDGKMVLHLHDELTLNLEGAAVAAPSMRILSEENGRPLTEFYNGEEINRNLYQDAEKMATVSVKASGKSVELEGVVGPNHRIHPLPAMERSESGLVPHMIHEIEHNEMSDKVLTFMDENQLSQLSARSDWESAPSPPLDVTVEVFMVVDKPHFSYFNKTKDLLVYLCVTMNSANLRFGDMTRPRVKLILTGTEQHSEDTFVVGNTKYVHDSRTLTVFKSYAYKKKSAFGNPDVVFFFSGRDVVTDDDKGGLSTNGLGIAYLGGLCTEAYVGLGEDRPGLYNGMFTFSHEMGHLLGAQHDGSKRVALVPGYVGSEGCPWDDGFLMSYKDKGANHQQFSRCSLKQMSLVITYRGKTCWAILSTAQQESDLFPGNIMSIDAVCRDVFPNERNVSAKMIFPKAGECRLKCSYDKQEGWSIYTYSRDTSAPDFSSCGPSKVCVRGRCVYDKERKGQPQTSPTPANTVRTTEPAPSTTARTRTTTTTTRTTTRSSTRTTTTRRLWRWTGWKNWPRWKY